MARSREKGLLIETVMDADDIFSSPAPQFAGEGHGSDGAVRGTHRPAGEGCLQPGIKPQTIVAPITQVAEKIRRSVQRIAAEEDLRNGGAVEGKISRRQHDISLGLANQAGQVALFEPESFRRPPGQSACRKVSADPVNSSRNVPPSNTVVRTSLRAPPGAAKRCARKYKASTCTGRERVHKTSWTLCFAPSAECRRRLRRRIFTRRWR